MAQDAELIQQIAALLNPPNTLILDKFSGDGSSSPAVWWPLFTNWVALQKYSDQQALQSLPLQLSGPAATWFHMLPQEKKQTINSVKEEFYARFQNKSANKKLYKLEQTQMETTTQYLDRVQCLAFNAQDMTEESIVGLAVEGLLPKYKSCVLSHDPKTFSSLRNALEIASAVAECNPQINALNSMTELVQAIKEIKEEVKNIKTPSFQPVTQPPLPPAFHGYHMPPPISRPAQQFHHQPQAQMKTCNGCGIRAYPSKFG
ncbi:hypothetical protein KUTeg_014677 [Tegillarca granosa]|uniref:Retrotransposon gag domain-containing protein n=1 Tax=Tegillarca granosa TaxID=220873 RepID=A0ABQ9ETU6_TEGGR|nr:hypothetical protein KUTeg_014677 [Tegillarca granosa]